MENLSRLLESSIEFELNASRLYMLYSEAFADDNSFWWQLAMEEKNHAALLKSGRLYLGKGILPDDIVGTNLAAMDEANAGVLQITDNWRVSPMGRDEAYRFALRLEESAVELHFQHLLDKKTDEKVIKIFQNLNRNDRDHADRIRLLMESRGIASD